MGDVLAWHAERDGARVAVVCGEEVVTFADLDRRAILMAHGYRVLGVRPGDRVAILLPNSVAFYVATFAVWKLGATPVPLSGRLPPPERDAMLDLADPALVVGLHGEGISWSCVPPGFDPGDHGDAAPLPPVEATQPWKAIGSGGSTGRPKLIVAGRAAVVDPAEIQYGIVPGDVVLVAGPMYHQGPFIFSTRGLFSGNPVVVMTRFDPVETLALIERHHVSWTYFVPTMTHRIWRLDAELRDTYDLSSLRLVMSTGAPWAPWLKEAWIHWLGPEKILEGYGGTEEHGGLTITGHEALEHPGSIGRAHDNVRVLDELGTEVSHGTRGELYFRSADPPAASLGAESRDFDGWRSYGDVGYIGEDGYVYLVDRRTDMIVSGGANVYPAEIEAALEAHPSVRSAVVIGLPDDDLGQRVHAIVDAPAPPPSDDQLRAHLRERIAAYKIPRTFELVDAPLRDDAGKVRRSELRDARAPLPPSP